MSDHCVAVFGSSQALPGAPAYALARRLGAALAGRGATVRCGGYAGVMEAVAAGAREGGGRVIGCTLDWFQDLRTPSRELDEVHSSPDLASRLECLLRDARSAVVLPGGVGTLNELFWVWTMLHHGHGGDRAIVLLGNPWPELLAVLFGRFEFDERTRAMVRTAASPEEAAAIATEGRPR